MVLNKLKKYLEKLSHEGIALAFSGGVDSSLLLAVLADMQKENDFKWHAFTIHSSLQDTTEINEAKAFALKYGVNLQIFSFNPFSFESIRNNRTDRCYHCKKAFFSLFINEAQKQGLKYLIDGTNADDLSVYRPGRKALKELGVVSPLAELGISKKHIRQLSEQMGLSTAHKPAVPCLATRFEYNTELNSEMIEKAAKGEKIVKKLFPQIDNIRLRIHGSLVRLEVSEQYITNVANNKKMLIQKLSELGFDYITLDLAGFHSGSFDRKNQ